MNLDVSVSELGLNVDSHLELAFKSQDLVSELEIGGFKRSDGLVSYIELGLKGGYLILKSANFTNELILLLFISSTLFLRSLDVVSDLLLKTGPCLFRLSELGDVDVQRLLDVIGDLNLLVQSKHNCLEMINFHDLLSQGEIGVNVSFDGGG